MGIPGLSSCRQSTKTMWFIATEIGEGNHQDQSLSRNKLFGCTSRLGTMYPMYASLMSGGAKGIYHYYMVPSPGADRFWDDTLIRDPRQLEWMGTFARIVENAPGLADYEPAVYYRFPALLQPNSGLLYSDPHRDYFNTDCLWWVDPAGKLPNGAWLLPTFSLRVPTEMMFINLENAPATHRWAAEVNAYLAGDHRVTWLGYRRDLGTVPGVDRFYSREFAKDDDGIEFQVLKPTGDCRVVAANREGKVWNLMAGRVQVISKNAENRTGWRPDRVVLDGRMHRYDYQTFLRDRLGVETLRGKPGVEAFAFRDGGRRVTVVALEAERDKSVQLGGQLPAWGLDATGNRVGVPAEQGVSLTIREIPAGSSARFTGGEAIAIPASGELAVDLRPDRLELANSQGKLPWAREGLVFNTLNSRAGAILSSPAGRPSPKVEAGPSPVPPPGILVEAERPVTSNFNLDTFSGLAGCSNDGLLGLATAVPPPAPDGYVAVYRFNVVRPGRYALRVHEGYLASASPGRWRLDDGPWHEATNALVPQDIRLVAQYNALEDERMIFATYNYGPVGELAAGPHTFTYGVVSRRPGGLDIGLENSTPFGKLLDCFEFVPQDGAEAGALALRVNRLANPSCEQDTGGWTATEWTSDRWKWVELRDEQGWNRDFWWTKKVGAEGRIFIDGLMDLGGLTVRQSFAGVRSLRIRAGEGPRRFSADPVAVTPGERIRFGGWMRTESLGARADIRIRFLDGDGREVSQSASEAMSGDTHWTPVDAGQVPVPQGARQAILDCRIDAARPGQSRFGREWRDTAWFDDLYLYRP
jgi:hypothetical protein